MSKAQQRFANLTRGQMRDIYYNHGGLTTRQLGRKYGVADKVIRGARIAVGRSRVRFHAARVA